LIPTVSAARGCSPQARIRRPIGVLNMTTYERITSAKLSQIIRLRWPNAGPKKYTSRMWKFTSGIDGTPAGMFSPP
jgi:hypothetical protein